MTEWNIKDKVCIVTGANCGIGRETALELVRLGAARVILACRNIKAAEEAADFIKSEVGITDEEEFQRRIVIRQIDLGSLESIRQFAKNIIDTEDKLHLLVDNAGVYGPRNKQVTSDGFELSFGTNHLGHFLLTNLLLDLLKKSAPSRVVVVASVAYLSCLPFGLNVDDPNYENSWFNSWMSYSHSKLANILFARELDRRLNADSPSGVTVYSLHPGSISTNFLRHHWIQAKIAGWFLMTPQQGAKTTLYCSTEPGIEQRSGKYFNGRGVGMTFGIAKDDAKAKRLWEISEKLVEKNDQ